MTQQSDSWAYTHNPKRNMHPSVHSSTVYNSQDMEATECPSTEEKVKEMWHIYILLTMS